MVHISTTAVVYNERIMAGIINRILKDVFTHHSTKVVSSIFTNTTKVESSIFTNTARIQ